MGGVSYGAGELLMPESADGEGKVGQVMALDGTGRWSTGYGHGAPEYCHTI